MYSFDIWVYTHRGEGKVELFKPVDDFDKDRKNVRILVWGNHCALIKTIETLLDRPNKMNYKLHYCDRCTDWFNKIQMYSLFHTRDCLS